MANVAGYGVQSRFLHSRGQGFIYSVVFLHYRVDYYVDSSHGFSRYGFQVVRRGVVFGVFAILFLYFGVEATMVSRLSTIGRGLRIAGL